VIEYIGVFIVTEVEGSAKLPDCLFSQVCLGGKEFRLDKLENAPTTLLNLDFLLIFPEIVIELMLA